MTLYLACALAFMFGGATITLAVLLSLAIDAWDRRTDERDALAIAKAVDVIRPYTRGGAR